MQAFGRLLIITGAVLILLGVAFYFFKGASAIPRLPGDILIRKKNFTFYFPVVTSLILSLVFTLLLYLISRK